MRTSFAWPILAMLAGLLAIATNLAAQRADFTPAPGGDVIQPSGLEAVLDAEATDTPRADLQINAATPRPDPRTDDRRLVRVDLTQVGREAIEGGQVRWSVLFLSACLIAIVALAVSLQRRLTREGREAAPGQAFLDHARRLGLTWPERVLLWRIARACDLPNVLTLLIAAGTFRHHTQRFVRRLPASRRGRTRETLQRVHRKAFLHRRVDLQLG